MTNSKNITEQIVTIEETDGFLREFKQSEFEADVRNLSALMLVLDKTNTAGKELMRISRHTESPGYTQFVAEGAVSLLTGYMLADAETWQYSIILDNLHSFLFSYRIVRPVVPDTKEAEQ